MSSVYFFQLWLGIRMWNIPSPPESWDRDPNMDPCLCYSISISSGEVLFHMDTKGLCWTCVCHVVPMPAFSLRSNSWRHEDRTEKSEYLDQTTWVWKLYQKGEFEVSEISLDASKRINAYKFTTNIKISGNSPLIFWRTPAKSFAFRWPFYCMLYI